MIRDNILKILLEMSDRQFDDAAKGLVDPIIGMSDEDAKEPMFKLLCKCVHFAWCSDFEIMVLSQLVKKLDIDSASEDRWVAELKKEFSNDMPCTGDTGD